MKIFATAILTEKTACYLCENKDLTYYAKPLNY